MTDLFADDRPILSEEDDRLGFDGPAEKLADAILDFASPEGFVIGLEGPWGSGKSSLINLIAHHLEASKKRPRIVHFAPWLISSREGMMAQLFSEIATAADSILDEAIDEKKDKASWLGKRLSKNKNVADKARYANMFEKYSGHLVWAGNAARVAGAFVPVVGEAGKKVAEIGKDGGSLIREKSLSKRREAIKTELRKLERQIVVFVDDLDRLEPKDVGEVVRLVRAVADFPNVVYVLSYSRKILVKNLQQAYSLDADDRYIDKIVQVTYQVPKPEDFELRRMFTEGLNDIFPNELAQASSGADISPYIRIQQAIDIEGGKSLKSPRDVSRALNALRLYGGAVIDKIDLGDMVWLQLIRLRNDDFYQWIEAYVNTIGAIINDNGNVDAAERERITQVLTEIVEAEVGESNVDSAMYRLATTLPGIQRQNVRGNNATVREWSVLEGINLQHLGAFIDSKRVASPSHYRYYFAFSEPKNALSEEGVAEFFELLETDFEAAVNLFVDICRTTTSAGRSRAELFVQRLEGMRLAGLTPQQQVGILIAFSKGLDDAALISPRGDFGHREIWDAGMRVVHNLVSNMEAVPHVRLEEIFGEGDALGWLSQIIRRETFVQGLYGDRGQPEEMWTFTRDQLLMMVNMFVENAQSRPFAELVKTPDFSNVLFAWAQGVEGGYDVVREWLADKLGDDEVFLDFLLGMRGWAQSTVTYYPLRRENLERFIDVDAAFQRANELMESNEERLSSKAASVVEAFENGRDDNF